jgi:hypothetical protein
MSAYRESTSTAAGTRRLTANTAKSLQGATNTEDDFEVIQNHLPIIDDDHGDTFDDPTPLQSGAQRTHLRQHKHAINKKCTSLH